MFGVCACLRACMVAMSIMCVCSFVFVRCGVVGGFACTGVVCHDVDFDVHVRGAGVVQGRVLPPGDGR